jgi:hypothetical protein
MTKYFNIIICHWSITVQHMIRNVQNNGPKCLTHDQKCSTHGLKCPKIWSEISLNMVRSVPKSGPKCLVRNVHGPKWPVTIQIYTRLPLSCKSLAEVRMPLWISVSLHVRQHIPFLFDKRKGYTYIQIVLPCCFLS